MIDYITTTSHLLLNMHTSHLIIRILFIIQLYVPPKVLRLIGWVDEVVVWIVRILGCTVQIDNVTAPTNVQEQPA